MIFHPDLCRTWNMAGGMKRKLYSIDAEYFPKFYSLKSGCQLKSVSYDWTGRNGTEITFISPSGVIRMAMRNQCHSYRFPRIQINIRLWTINSFVVKL